jgi:hypothetical protein
MANPLSAASGAASSSSDNYKAANEALGTIQKYASERERNKSNERMNRRDVREKKRKTLADILEAAMGRQFEAGKDRRSGQREISAHQMKALSDAAANIRSALGR